MPDLLFSPSMVAPILNTRLDCWPAEPIDPALPFKFVTRRIVAPPADLVRYCLGNVDEARAMLDKGGFWNCESTHWQHGDERLRQNFQPGTFSRLLTTWAVDPKYEGVRPLDLPHHVRIWTQWDGTNNRPLRGLGKFRPGRFLPLRFRGRLPLVRIVSVRVERVQEITEEEILAEGVAYPVSVDRHPLIRLTGPCPPCNYHRPINLPAGETLTHGELLRCHFASLWDTVNGEGSWESSPWVWRIEFARVTPARKPARRKGGGE